MDRQNAHRSFFRNISYLLYEKNYNLPSFHKEPGQESSITNAKLMYHAPRPPPVEDEVRNAVWCHQIQSFCSSSVYVPA